MPTPFRVEGGCGRGRNSQAVDRVLGASPPPDAPGPWPPADAPPLSPMLVSLSLTTRLTYCYPLTRLPAPQAARRSGQPADPAQSPSRSCTALPPPPPTHTHHHHHTHGARPVVLARVMLPTHTHPCQARRLLSVPPACLPAPCAHPHHYTVCPVNMQLRYHLHGHTPHGSLFRSPRHRHAAMPISPPSAAAGRRQMGGGHLNGCRVTKVYGGPPTPPHSPPQPAEGGPPPLPPPPRGQT